MSDYDDLPEGWTEGRWRTRPSPQGGWERYWSPPRPPLYSLVTRSPGLGFVEYVGIGLFVGLLMLMAVTTR